MLNIVLVEPKIPQNTGNIIRLAVNCGANLHLVRPFGFVWNEKHVKRSAMDYIEDARIFLWDDFEQWKNAHNGRIFLIETTGAQTIYNHSFLDNDALVFGSEDTGLSSAIQTQYPILNIPQIGGRSINLSNAVAITMYEAWRQLDFKIPTPDLAS